jgi:hypothetical protein
MPRRLRAPRNLRKGEKSHVHCGLSLLRSVVCRALSLTGLLVLCGALIEAPAGHAARPVPAPQRLWQHFPLNGQGTSSNPSPPPAPRAKIHEAPLRPPTPAPAPRAGGARSRGAKAAMAVVLTAIAATLVLAGAYWAPRRRRRRLLELLRLAPGWLSNALRRLVLPMVSVAGDAISALTSTRLSLRPFRRRFRLAHAARRFRASRRAPALALAGAASAPGAAGRTARELPSLHLTSRLAWWRRGQVAPPEARASNTGAGADEEPDTQSGLILGRLLPYSLRSGDETEVPASSQHTLQQTAVGPGRAPAVSTATTIIESVSTRVGTELERARDGHYALSLAALQLQPRDDLALEPSGVHAAVETAARELLGEGADVEVVVSDDATLWLILPGVLPKRAHAVAELLQTLLASSGAKTSSVAVVGYPRDGTTVNRLVRRCLHALSGEPTPEEEAAPA